MSAPAELRDRLAGLLLGTAVGDALGLPLEGLTPERARRLFPPPVRHRLLPGRGMISDDTEHALFVAQAFLSEPRDPVRFQRLLAWKLRGWIAALPAGVGLATLRACLRLWLGIPPDRAGVFSAGNGPAMRSALLGALFADDPERMAAFVSASTRLTHTDPRAERGALAVAKAAAWSAWRARAVARTRGAAPEEREEPNDSSALLGELAALGPPGDAVWERALGAIPEALRKGESVPVFASSLGLSRGVTGFVDHTVPVALYAFLRHRGDFVATLEAALACGGDTDTVGAIAGALAGIEAGEAELPRAWVDGIADWPRGAPLLRAVAARLAGARTAATAPGPVPYPVALVPARNLVFLAVVLLHGLRRLLPPYCAHHGHARPAPARGLNPAKPQTPPEGLD